MNSHNLTCLTMITILEHESLEWLTQDTYLGIDCMTQIRMIPQDLVKYSVNNWTKIYPPIYSLYLVCQLLLEVNKSQCTTTCTWCQHCLNNILHIYAHLKKTFEALFTIRTVLNNLLNEHVIVIVWMISSMKKLLYLPNQLLPVAIY